MTTIDLSMLALKGSSCLYALAALAAGARLVRPSAVVSRAAWVLLSVAIAAHVTAFMSRALEAERLPIQNLFESLVGVALLAALLGVVLAWLRRDLLCAMVGAAAAAVALTVAAWLPIPGRVVEPEAAILATSPLLAWHVGVILTGYALVTLGAGMSLGTLAASRRPGSTRLAELDRAQALLARLAFVALALGIALGAWWADRAWGRWWGWDPKETWALLTCLCSLTALHAGALVSPRRRAAFVAACNLGAFACMLWSYFGVNLLFPGLHSYAG